MSAVTLIYTANRKEVIEEKLFQIIDPTMTMLMRTDGWTDDQTEGKNQIS